MTVADQIRKLVQLGKLEEGLKMLNDWAAANDSSLHNTTILLLSRFNQLKRNSLMGIISSSDAERSRNQLSYAVLSTLDDLPDNAKAPVYSGAVVSDQEMNPGSEKKSKKLFISYAREDRAWVDKLEKHLTSLQRQGLIDAWTDSQILPGQQWNSSILKELREADIYVFMVSVDFIYSEFINKHEVPEAMQRNQKYGTPIIPVILRPCSWNSQPYSKFQALPTNALAIAKWQDEDEAFVSVVEGIGRIVK